MENFSLEIDSSGQPEKSGQVNPAYIEYSGENIHGGGRGWRRRSSTALHTVAQSYVKSTVENNETEIDNEGRRKSTTVTTVQTRSRKYSVHTLALNWTDQKIARKYEPGETRRMTRNIIIISIAFTLLFTADNSMTNLQSSLYPQGLGNSAMATVFVALVISSMFLPTWLMSKLTVKWCLVITMLGYTPYIAAQFYPRYSTLIPAAFIAGLSAAPLWISKCTYLTLVANEYASQTGAPPSEIIVRYFGIFFCLFQSSQIWGNLISSTIFSSGDTTSPYNSTIFLEDKCGANFCPCLVNCDEEEGTDEGVDDTIKLFLGVCMAFTFAAIGLVAFIDPLSRYGEKDEDVQKSHIKQGEGNLLVETFRQMKNPHQLLLIPLTIFSGMDQGFIFADFSEAYITCAYGVQNVGYVLITSGICDAIMSLGFGWLVKYTGRVPIFLLGAAIDIGVLTVFMFWRPNPEEAYVFFIIAGFWGTADAIWQTQINAMYGAVFPDNEMSAFSNYRLWEALGFILAYVNASLLCVRIKLIIMLGFLLLGIVGYLIVEIRIIKNKRGKSDKT